MNAGQFLALHPEFRTLEHHIVEWQLMRANLRVDPTKWGAKTQEAIALLTAHFLSSVLYEQSSLAGNAMSLNAGQAGTRPTPTGSREDFSSTSYGTQYLNLLSTLPITGICF